MVVSSGPVPARIGAVAERGLFHHTFVLFGGLCLSGALAVPAIEAALAARQRALPAGADS